MPPLRLLVCVALAAGADAFGTIDTIDVSTEGWFDDAASWFDDVATTVVKGVKSTWASMLDQSGDAVGQVEALIKNGVTSLDGAAEVLGIADARDLMLGKLKLTLNSMADIEQLHAHHMKGTECGASNFFMKSPACARQLQDAEPPSRARQLQGTAAWPWMGEPAEGLDSWWSAAATWASFNIDAHIEYVKLIKRSDGPSSGGIVFSPGHTEPCVRYQALFHWMANVKGYSPIFCIDHRSQGRSARLADDDFKAHGTADGMIADFTKLVDITLSDADMLAAPAKFLLAHSMGGGIAANYLLNTCDAPPVFDAAVFNAPAIKASTAPIPYFVAEVISWAIIGLGFGSSYPPTLGGSFEEYYGTASMPVSSSSTTSNTAAISAFNQRCIAERYEKKAGGGIGLCVGDATTQRTQALFDLHSKIAATYPGWFGGSSHCKVATPVLIQQASDDVLVQPGAQDDFCDKACESCELRELNSLHNIWYEAPQINKPALEAVMQFLALHT